jgi:hypothetical protein
MIIAPQHTLQAYAGQRCLAKLLKDMVVGFKDAITWARDSFRNRDGRAVMQDWMLHWDRDGDSGDHRRSYHEPL